MFVQTSEETPQELTGRAKVMAAALQILDEQGVALNLPQAGRGLYRDNSGYR